MLRCVQGQYEIPATMVRAFRPTVPVLVDAMTSRIRQEVAAFSGPDDGRRHKMIARTVQCAIDLFLDVLEGRPASGKRVDELFWRIGRSEAMDSQGLDGIRAACHIASLDGWREIRGAASRYGLPDDAVGPLGDLLLAYLDHLVAQVRRGLTSAQKENAPARDRHRLFRALLSGPRTADEVAALATGGGWHVPESCVVLVAFTGKHAHRPPDVPGSVLLHVAGGEAVAIVDPEHVPAAVKAMRLLPLASPVAMSWPIALEDVRHGYRWSRRAIDLASLGLIKADPVIHCSDHRSALWLHADPVLQSEVCDDLLGPLLTQTNHQRAVLGETFLLWLRGHASAPKLARELSVHEQTVRRRLRRLRTDFASILARPEEKVTLLMLLESMVPVWLSRAGRADEPVPRSA